MGRKGGFSFPGGEQKLLMELFCNIVELYRVTMLNLRSSPNRGKDSLSGLNLSNCYPA
jgi:hypothetical protein